MLFFRPGWIVKLADFPVAIALALAAPPAHALERGDLQAGLYTAPGQLFTVKSPLGPRPILIDGFDRTTGAVTFIDEAGQLFGVVCTPNLDILAGADIDFETNAAILRNWLREATLPMFFERMTPGSSIVREEPTEFEGQAAWVAIIHMPRGSPMIRNDPEVGPIRQDSWRGVVVFSRGNQTYLLMTEATVESADAQGQFDAAAAGWNDFLPRLTEFYRGMSFKALPDIQQKPQPERQHVGAGS